MATATMASDGCGRCGSQGQVPRGLCKDCEEWLEQRSTISTADVVESVQFSTSPIPSTDRVALSIGATAIPASLSLFSTTVLLIDTYNDRTIGYVETLPSAALELAFVAFLCALFTFAAAFGGALLARRRPLLAVGTGMAIVSVLMIPLVVMATNGLLLRYLEYRSLPRGAYGLDVFFKFLVVMQGVGLVLLFAALIVASLRWRQIARARKRLACVDG